MLYLPEFPRLPLLRRFNAPANFDLKCDMSAPFVPPGSSGRIRGTADICDQYNRAPLKIFTETLCPILYSQCKIALAVLAPMGDAGKAAAVGKPQQPEARGKTVTP